MAEETFQLVRENLSRNAQRRKSVYNAKVRENTYSVGESVWYYYPRKYTKNRLNGKAITSDHIVS